MTLMSDPYQHLVNGIRCSQDSTKHVDGEQALASLKQHTHYSVLLIGVCLDESLLLGDRQMAFILLKQLIRVQWDSDSIPLEYKSQIRKSVLDLFTKCINDKPLLTQCCLLIAAIAEYDLQTHEWPDLLPALLRFASHPDTAPASIYCMSLLVSDLPQEHILDISRHLYPVLTQMFGTVSNPPLLRYRSICVFTALVDSFSCAEDEQESLREILYDYAPAWFQMVGLLFTNPPDNHLKFALHIEACDVVTTLSRSINLKNRPQLLEKLPDLALCILNFSLPLLSVYQSKYIDGQTNDADDDDDVSIESNDGIERSSLAQFLTSVLDLFSVICWPGPGSSSQFLANHLDSIVHLMVITLQIPSGEEPMFEDDVDYMIAYSARSASKDLASRLQNFLTFDNCCSHSSLEPFTKTCLSTTSNWRVVEAGLYMLGQLSPIPDETFPIIIECAMSTNTYIRVRALWVFKQILTSGELSDSVFNGIRNAIISNFSEECEAIRLTAIDCLSTFSSERLLSIGDMLGYTLQQICFSVRISTSQDHISTHLIAIQNLLGLCQVRQAHLHLVSSALMDTWSNNVSDAFITSRLADTFAVCCVPDTISSLQAFVIPFLVDTLKRCDVSAHESLLDLLSKLVIPCGESLLSDELCDAVVPLVVQIITNSDDLAVVSSCITCLTNLARNPSRKIGDFLTLIMPVTYSLMQNRTMVIALGNLIYAVLHVHHVRFQEHDIKVLVHLLQDRILASGASFATVGDSVLALSKLIHAFGSVLILRLLIEVNESAPERFFSLFKKWVELYEDVHSPYLKKLSLLALSEIALIRLPEIDNLLVTGYTIVDTNAPRRTRSQGPATAVIHKQIYLPAKIISLLVTELISSNAPSEVSSDSQQSQNEKAAIDGLVSDFLNDFEDIDQESPEQVLLEGDPIAKMDLSAFVPNFIRKFHVHSDNFEWCFSQLSPHDQSIVQKCLNFPL